MGPFVLFPGFDEMVAQAEGNQTRGEQLAGAAGYSPRGARFTGLFMVWRDHREEFLETCKWLGGEVTEPAALRARAYAAMGAVLRAADQRAARLESFGIARRFVCDGTESIDQAYIRACCTAGEIETDGINVEDLALHHGATEWFMRHGGANAPGCVMRLHQAYSKYGMDTRARELTRLFDACNQSGSGMNNWSPRQLRQLTEYRQGLGR